MNVVGIVDGKIVYTSSEFAVEGKNVESKIMHQDGCFVALYVNPKIKVDRYQEIVNETVERMQQAALSTAK